MEREGSLIFFLVLLGLCFSPFNLMLAIGLLYIDFIMCRYVPYIPDLSNTFFLKRCCILSKTFPTSNEMIIHSFFFKFVYMVIVMDWPKMSSEGLHLAIDEHRYRPTVED